MDHLNQRMYFLVPYALSGIQKGIQAGHAAIEYAQCYFEDKDYQSWAISDKTFILLNGGTMNDKNGSIQQHLELMQANLVKLQYFREPDLNDAISAIAFLVDERVYDHKKYPLPEYPTSRGNYLTSPPRPIPVPQVEIDAYNAKVLEILGTEQNVFLRGFLKGFHLAAN
jgi:hypothetical protein